MSRVLVFVTVFIALVRFCQADTESGKANFIQARSSLQRYVESCLENPEPCQLTSSEKQLLAGVLFDIKNEKGLQFISAKQNPGKFASAGTHRVAMTGLHRGDPIYLNLDDLGSIDYPTAIAILTHEFGHHEGINDTDDRVLDVLGSKVREFTMANSEISTLKEFNQPAVGLMVFNKPQEKVGGATSEVLIYDGLQISSLEEGWDENMSCPIGLTRQGGLYISQLRNEGAFDWDAQANSQDFGFRLQAQEVCVGGGQTEIEFYTLRLSVKLQPTQGEAKRDWWKTTPGVISENPDMTVFQRGDVDYEKVFQVGSGLPLKVLKVESPKQNLVNGDEWTLKATIEAPSALNFESCRGDFTSKSFVNFGYKPRATIDFKSCKFQPIGGNRFEVTLSTVFPQATPSRDYFLYSIEMKISGQSLSLLGIPVFPTEVHLHSTNEPSPLKTLMVALTQRLPNGQNGFIDANIDLKRPHRYSIPVRNLFAFQVLMDSTAPILETSGVSILLAFNNGQRDYSYGYIVPLRDSFKNGWGLPVNGGTEVQPYPGIKNRYVFSLSLRGKADTGRASAITMISAHMHFVYLMNESLQEDFEYLPVDVVSTH